MLAIRHHVMVLVAIGLLVVACGPDPALGPSGADRVRAASPWDWPGFGYDAQHTFHGRTTLTPALVPKLAKAWTFPTGDAVTATPTVVAGTVYVGSWDGWFYAVGLRTGRLRWKFHLKPQNAVQPVPGVTPRPVDSDGGLVTSSAWFEPRTRTHPDLVLFGGGYTLYALDAHTGRKVWSHDYTGHPGRPPDPDHDNTRIFSSPMVVDGKVIVGVDVDGQDNSRGYVAAAAVDTGRTRWILETNRIGGKLVNDGCGSVWTSASLSPDLHQVYLATSDCHLSNRTAGAEEVFAVNVADGTRVWTFRPGRDDPGCDYAFGATVNVGLDRTGTTTFVGIGGKDGTYYSLDPKTGRLRWKRNVVHGGVAGGFIGTPSYDGTRIVGSTAIGDFGNFGPDGEVHCDPSDPRDVSQQEPGVHAFDARTGALQWQLDSGRAFGATTSAGGMTFHGEVFTSDIEVHDAVSGRVLARVPLPALCWSGIATVGNSLVFGTGAAQQGSPDGINAYTPGGVAPQVPTVPARG